MYWALRLSLDSFTSAALYFGYLLLLCLFDFLITGAWPPFVDLGYAAVRQLGGRHGSTSHRMAADKPEPPPEALATAGAPNAPVIFIYRIHVVGCGLMCVYLG